MIIPAFDEQNIFSVATNMIFITSIVASKYTV